MVTGAFSSETEKPTNMAKEKEKQNKKEYYNKNREKKHACNIRSHTEALITVRFHTHTQLRKLFLGECVRTAENMSQYSACFA